MITTYQPIYLAEQICCQFLLIPQMHLLLLQSLLVSLQKEASSPEGDWLDHRPDSCKTHQTYQNPQHAQTTLMEYRQESYICRRMLEYMEDAQLEA